MSWTCCFFVAKTCSSTISSTSTIQSLSFNYRSIGFMLTQSIDWLIRTVHANANTKLQMRWMKFDQSGGHTIYKFYICRCWWAFEEHIRNRWNEMFTGNRSWQSVSSRGNSIFSRSTLPGALISTVRHKLTFGNRINIEFTDALYKLLHRMMVRFASHHSMAFFAGLQLRSTRF